MKTPPLQSADNLKDTLKQYFQGFNDEHTRVAWCTSVGPAELLRSFGFETYFPENHGALLGAVRTAGDYIPQAIKAGYAGDVCSYTTSDIGAYLKGQTPLERYGLKSIPRPDIIVYCTNQCREVQDWFTFFAKEFQCPIIGIHPPRHLNTISDEMIQQVVAEYKILVHHCEQISKRRFDIDAFRETVQLSREATELWQQCLQTSTSKPAPWSFFDSCIHMAPIVVLRGTLAAKSYYERLLSELRDRILDPVRHLNHERTRIYWDGMPIWGKLRVLSEVFAEHDSAVVASTYCNSWIFDAFDESHPFESTALAYLRIFINRSEEAKMEYLTRMMKEYDIDGVIFHDAKTCFNNSNARFGLPQRLKQQCGLPVQVVEGDLCDLRFFSEGQTVTRIETFIEQIETHKAHAQEPSLI